MRWHLSPLVIALASVALVATACSSAGGTSETSSTGGSSSGGSGGASGSDDQGGSGRRSLTSITVETTPDPTDRRSSPVRHKALVLADEVVGISDKIPGPDRRKR